MSNLILVEERIEQILKRLKECAENKKLEIKWNKSKNTAFSMNFNLNEDKVSKIIKKLVKTDYVEVLKNTNPNHSEDEYLHVFAPILRLRDLVGVNRRITLYVKVKFTNNNEDEAVLISFHETEHKVDYMFKK